MKRKERERRGEEKCSERENVDELVTSTETQAEKRSSVGEKRGARGENASIYANHSVKRAGGRHHGSKGVSLVMGFTVRRCWQYKEE